MSILDTIRRWICPKQPPKPDDDGLAAVAGEELGITIEEFI